MGHHNPACDFLFDHQVPDEPRECDHWPCKLRWLVAVMDPDDVQLAFAASLMSQSLQRPGLTPKQHVAAERLLNRIRDSHREQSLDCQNNNQADLMATCDNTAIDIAHMSPEGSG